MEFQPMVPELTVFDIEESKEFYINTIGFRVVFERPEDKFIFLDFQGSQFMLEEIHENGWNTGSLSYPLGQGVNFEIGVKDVEGLYKKLQNEGVSFYREIGKSLYNIDGRETEQVEFLVQDPNGYLLRFVNA